MGALEFPLVLTSSNHHIRLHSLCLSFVQLKLWTKLNHASVVAGQILDTDPGSARNGEWSGQKPAQKSLGKERPRLFVNTFAPVMTPSSPLPTSMPGSERCISLIGLSSRSLGGACLFPPPVPLDLHDQILEICRRNAGDPRRLGEVRWSNPEQLLPGLIRKCDEVPVG